MFPATILSRMVADGCRKMQQGCIPGYTVSSLQAGSLAAMRQLLWLMRLARSMSAASHGNSLMH